MSAVPLKQIMRRAVVEKGHKFEDAGVNAWQCGCGSCRFILRDDGKAECGNCGTFAPWKVVKK